MTRIVEIRTYRLRPGAGPEYERLIKEIATPMLARHGIDVIAFGQSKGDADGYCLIRAFDDLDHRRHSEDAFYGSAEWREGPRESILALIESYTDLVLELDEQTIDGLRQTGASESAKQDDTGLSDPRALDILTAEHWALLSSRTLGYTEMFGRASILVASLSGTVIALALLAQATGFGRETLSLAVVLLSVALFIGLTTFARSVTINFEDARWLTGMGLLRRAYLQILPEVEPFLVPFAALEDEKRALGYGVRQRLANLTRSLTTTSGVIATLDSVVIGTLSSAVTALIGAGLAVAVVCGATASLVSAVGHLRYAAAYRQGRQPTAPDPKR